MGNMAYCRFENTSNDLDDCNEAIQDEELKDMSRREIDGFVKLILIAKDIAERFEDLNENEIYEYIKDKQG